MACRLCVVKLLELLVSSLALRMEVPGETVTFIKGPEMRNLEAAASILNAMFWSVLEKVVFL